MTGGELVMIYKMQRDSKGYYMNIEDIPAEAFMECIRVKDIVKARILTRKEKIKLNRGQEDVLCRSAGGLQYFITRGQMKSEYRHMNNEKISLSKMETGKETGIYRNDGTLAFAILIPKGVRAIHKGREIPSGYYIICYGTSEGLIDRSRIEVMTPLVFRKTCVMKPSEIINRNLGTGKELYAVSDESRRKNQKQLGGTVEAPSKEEKAPESKKSLNIGNMSDKVDRESEQKNEANKIKAVGRVTDEFEDTIGFVVENSIGRRVSISATDMLNVAEKGVVSNICVVDKNGTKFLRGIDIHIKELPKM